MTMASIRLEHLTKDFGSGKPAVDDVSLDIADREFMILVGPSGCGKSTILRMIVGLEDPTAGDIYIGDRRVNDLAPRHRNLAMVFQNYALYPHLTVYDNIAFPLRLHEVPDDDVRRRVEQVAQLLELSELLDRKPAHLSGGQRQRVAMGRALVRQADAYLFDEPLSNLDAKLRGQMRTEIARLQSRLGITTVYVTHDQLEAMTLGDRLAVLRRGVLQQVDTPRELYEQPVNLFVAGFVGSPPMNFMPAVVEGDTLRLPIGDVRLTAQVAGEVRGHGILIASVRPEHFEDLSRLDDRRRHRASSSRPTST
jgi:multiple sugar transport system ATP-binding protein